MSTLSVDALRTEFRLGDTWRPAVDGVSFGLDPGETLALVGESGCGKSVTALSIMGLLPPAATRITGSARVAGVDLIACSRRQLERLRGDTVAMVFQDPMTGLNPVMTVGVQVAESLRVHRGLSRTEARQRGHWPCWRR